MQGLKSFIMTEEVKTNHAERYLGFLDRYNSQVFLDLKRQLEKVWEPIVNDLSKKHKVPEDVIQDALLQNQRATPEIVLVTSPEKLVTSRAREPLEVTPSVKVPFVYGTQERHLLTKHVLAGAAIAMKKIADEWKEVFNFEHKGKLQPWFKIVNDPDEIRFQLSMGSGAHESFKTLYSVRVEYGKSGSKLKDFDRIYLTTLI